MPTPGTLQLEAPTGSSGISHESVPTDSSQLIKNEAYPGEQGYSGDILNASPESTLRKQLDEDERALAGVAAVYEQQEATEATQLQPEKLTALEMTGLASAQSAAIVKARFDEIVRFNYLHTNSSSDPMQFTPTGPSRADFDLAA